MKIPPPEAVLGWIEDCVKSSDKYDYLTFKRTEDDHESDFWTYMVCPRGRDYEILDEMSRLELNGYAVSQLVDFRDDDMAFLDLYVFPTKDHSTNITGEVIVGILKAMGAKS